MAFPNPLEKHRRRDGSCFLAILWWPFRAGQIFLGTLREQLLSPYWEHNTGWAACSSGACTPGAPSRQKFRNLIVDGAQRKYARTAFFCHQRDMKAEARLEYGAYLCQRQIENNIFKFFDHNAALYPAKIASIARAIGIKISSLGKRRSAHQVLESLLHGVRCGFTIRSLVQVLDDVEYVKLLGHIELRAVSFVIQRDFFARWLVDWRKNCQTFSLQTAT